MTDFSDGELKTNKADADGAPLETMFISQISSNFDQLISDQISFEDSWIYQKIKNLLYVPICKVDDDPNKWYIQSAYHVQINEGGELFRQLSADFTQIKSKLLTDINSGDGYIYTSNGSSIPIRSKDSKPSHIILHFLRNIIGIFQIRIMHFILKKNSCGKFMKWPDRIEMVLFE